MRLPSVSIPKKLRKTAFTVVALVWIADVVAIVTWSGKNPCPRSHTEVASHPDPNDGDPVVEVCEWYKKDPARNPWYPSNEFRTVKNWLTG